MITKVHKIVGIDISKDFFDTSVKMPKGYKHQKFTFSPDDISRFISTLDSDTLCVMESTGVYHLRLAYSLHDASNPVCVVNPLSAKRFIQASMSRSKTDKTDACRLIEYGAAMNPPLWKPDPDYIVELNQLLNVKEGLPKTLSHPQPQQNSYTKKM